MPANAQTTPWTTERQSMLVSLITEPYSCKWLAAEINKRTGSSLTRNSVISKIHRMGLAKPATPANTQNRPRKPRNRKISPERIVVDLFADALPSPDFLGVPWLEAVDSKTCMYPEGDGAHMLFCGQPRKDESKYCPGHHAICWVKPRVQKPNLWRAA